MNWKFLGCSLVATALAGLVTACNDSGNDPSSEVEQAGSMRLPLETTAASGNVYRLRNAQFVTWGPQTQVVVPPEDAASFTLTLSAGIHSVKLRPGWELWRMGPEETQVEAELISPNPLQASIQPDTETVLTFQFLAGNDVVVLGPGELTVDISVVEAACASDADCAPGEICQGSVCVPDSFCGNGIAEGVEQCDDGNMTSGDGCAASCMVEYCSDGVLQPGLGEACDDGNTLSGDGCSANCQIETSCGNSVIEGLEQCDDGNLVNSDGCSNTCQIEYCSDGVTQAGLGEACDDGNTLNVDGCSSTCQIEQICGDGVVMAAEQCDDGNLVNSDGCSNTCQIEYCSDGVLQPGLGEACDDGNTLNVDGCSSICQIEVICGDGVVMAAEQCDDGNTLNGDGCSAVCLLELCGDGVVEFPEACDDGNMVNGDGCRFDCHVIEPGWVCPVPGVPCSLP